MSATPPPFAKLDFAGVTTQQRQAIVQREQIDG
jgi:hypothetical protein